VELLSATYSCVLIATNHYRNGIIVSYLFLLVDSYKPL